MKTYFFSSAFFSSALFPFAAFPPFFSFFPCHPPLAGLSTSTSIPISSLSSSSSCSSSCSSFCSSSSSFCSSSSSSSSLVNLVLRRDHLLPITSAVMDIVLLREEGPNLGGEVGALALGGISVELIVVGSEECVDRACAGGCRVSCSRTAFPKPRIPKKEIQKFSSQLSYFFAHVYSTR